MLYLWICTLLVSILWGHLIQQTEMSLTVMYQGQEYQGLPMSSVPGQAPLKSLKEVPWWHLQNSNGLLSLYAIGVPTFLPLRKSWCKGQYSTWACQLADLHGQSGGSRILRNICMPWRENHHFVTLGTYQQWIKGRSRAIDKDRMLIRTRLASSTHGTCTLGNWGCQNQITYYEIFVPLISSMPMVWNLHKMNNARPLL